MKRKQFTFYRSFHTALMRVPEEYRLMAYRLICDYALNGGQVDLDQLPDPVALAFSLIQPNLDASRRKAAGGRKGRPGKKKRPVENAVENAPETSLERCEKDTEKKGEEKRKDQNETETEFKSKTELETEFKSKSELETELKSKSELKTEFKHKCDAPGARRAPAGRAAFACFWSRYPKKWNEKAAWEAWQAQNFDEEQAAQVMEALEQFRKSEIWRMQEGRFVPAAARWLSEGYYRSPPVRSFWEGGAWTPGEAELEAIQRVLEE